MTRAVADPKFLCVIISSEESKLDIKNRIIPLSEFCHDSDNEGFNRGFRNYRIAG